MHKLNFDDFTNFLTWDSIYWGIKKEIIEPDNAIEYANKLVEDNPDIDNPDIIELLIVDTNEKDAILSLVNKIISDDKRLKSNEKEALKMLRYVLLLELQRKAKNNQELLEKIEEIYADFNYPSDMEGFISYMPVQDDGYDVSKHTDKENEQRLINKFNHFMANEHKWIKANN